MKAVTVVPGRHAVELRDVAEPALDSATAVKLRVLEVGVCGTDREICAMDYGTPPAGSDPTGDGQRVILYGRCVRRPRA